MNCKILIASAIIASASSASLRGSSNTPSWQTSTKELEDCATIAKVQHTATSLHKCQAFCGANGADAGVFNSRESSCKCYGKGTCRVGWANDSLTKIYFTGTATTKVTIAAAKPTEAKPTTVAKEEVQKQPKTPFAAANKRVAAEKKVKTTLLDISVSPRAVAASKATSAALPAQPCADSSRGVPARKLFWIIPSCDAAGKSGWTINCK